MNIQKLKEQINHWRLTILADYYGYQATRLIKQIKDNKAND